MEQQPGELKPLHHDKELAELWTLARSLEEKTRWLEKENLLLWERIGKMQDELNDLARRAKLLD